MNLLHMKYAVEVARTNSINKAADRLYVGQPALSRAIRELESALGVTLFERSAKGMFLTQEGSEFVQYAQSILKQVEAVEKMFSDGKTHKTRFSASVTRASYIAEAFVRFSQLVNSSEVELLYRETDSMNTVNGVLQREYNLGIIRYAENFDRYYKTMIEDKGLACELISRFCCNLVFGKNSPLAAKDEIIPSDLAELTEISYYDPYVPSLPDEEVRRQELNGPSCRRIFVFERAGRYELLSRNSATYMWMSPLPPSLASQYGLVQRQVKDNLRIYKDVMIFRRDYSFTDADNKFAEQLIAVKRELLG